MTHIKFAITTATIVATLYDVLVLQFFNKNHAISNLPPFEQMSHFPILVIILGLVCGKYLGTMSTTRPSEQRRDNWKL